jgi:16S rRNA C967 or C1407 C5-methylase (RsmB/RsmF family)
LRLALAAAPLVRPGGRLVLVTCSIEWEENEAVLEEFLRRSPAFRNADLRGGLPRGLEAMLISPGAWRSLPSGHHDGFSVQVVERLGV